MMLSSEKTGFSRQMNYAVAAGLVLGTLVGVALDRAGIGVSLGICFGVILGAILDARTKQKANSDRHGTDE
jgi:hypothetical protein